MAGACLPQIPLVCLLCNAWNGMEMDRTSRLVCSFCAYSKAQLTNCPVLPSLVWNLVFRYTYCDLSQIKG
jgi:hypothetical protein